MTSTSFWTISRAVLSSTPPRTRRVLRSTWCPCRSGADWCLESDAVTHLGLQVFAMRWKRTFGTFSKAKGHGRDVSHPNDFFLKEAALCPIMDTHLRDYILCTFTSRAAPPLCAQTRPALITGIGGSNSALYAISLMVRQHNFMAMVS